MQVLIYTKKTMFLKKKQILLRKGEYFLSWIWNFSEATLFLLPKLLWQGITRNFILTSECHLRVHASITIKLKSKKAGGENPRKTEPSECLEVNCQ